MTLYDTDHERIIRKIEDEGKDLLKKINHKSNTDLLQSFDDMIRSGMGQGHREFIWTKKEILHRMHMVDIIR